MVLAVTTSKWAGTAVDRSGVLVAVMTLTFNSSSSVNADKSGRV